MFNLKWKSIGLVASGILFGTAGIKVLTSADAKKGYAQVTAAVLRAKDCIVNGTSKIQENCGDILAEAKEINAIRAEKEQTFESVEEVAEATEE